MYKPDWFEHARVQRGNEAGVSEVGGWMGEVGIGEGCASTFRSFG
jgi:hypothetical protein